MNMTIGQRIARKRREINLSQEALGERLGVSRQSVYKWESDGALPEVDKLVAMSRLFGVSVGWLLGAEEEPGADRPQPGTAEAPLTEGQLKVVEEIVDRYIAALPKPSRRRRWLWIAGGAAAALAVVLVVSNLFGRLDRVDRQYNDLQNAVGSVRSDVNGQIYSITSRVEEILKSQNSLAADYGTEILSADLAANTVTIWAWATPKTYVEGMTATFLADTGAGTVEVPGALGADREFSAEITCPLTDDISVSVVFMDGEKQETQLLYVYGELYRGSFTPVELQGHMFGFRQVDEKGSITLTDEYKIVVQDFSTVSAANGAIPQGEPAEIRVGFFCDKKLVTWLEPCAQPESYRGDYGESSRFFRLDSVTITPSHDQVYGFAAVVTDQFGREQVYEELPRYTLQGDELNMAGDAELEAATGMPIEAWWDLPWSYE